MCVHRVKLAKFSAMYQIDGKLKIGNRPPLGAGLVDTAVLLDGIGEPQALFDGHGARLLAVDVLARAGRQDRRHGVPAVACGNQHGIDVLTSQQFGGVPKGCAIIGLVVFVDHLFDQLTPFLLGIANGHELNIAFAEETA